MLKRKNRREYTWILVDTVMLGVGLLREYHED